MLSSRLIAQRLPDLPRWVEVRDLLLSAGCEISGFQEIPELTFVLRDPETATVFVVGRPMLEDIQAALQSSKEVIAPQEHADWLAQVLPGWRPSKIIVHALPSFRKLPITIEGKVRFLEPGTIPHLLIPEDLRGELKIGAEHSQIAATFVENQPVTFCYAGSRTETLWDVSIDTLPEYQRKGYAAMCSAYMIRHMQSQSRGPVWQALEENPASWRLAQKLGFVAVDELARFEL